MSQKPLFSFTSRLDGKTYDANWHSEGTRLVVNVPEVPPVGWSVAPPLPVGYSLTENIDLVRAFEEGRLSNPNAHNPYSERLVDTESQAIAWAFGALLR